LFYHLLSGSVSENLRYQALDKMIL
jgi:hypothetical protein